MKRKDLSSKIFGWISIIAFMITSISSICIFAFAIMRYQGIQGVEQLSYALKIFVNIFLISFIILSISSIGFRLSRK